MIKFLSYLISNVLALQSFAHYSQDDRSQDYDRLFSTYMEYCAATQIIPKGGEKGGAGGHATLYVHGLCKDYSVSYPKVIRCDSASDHSGVGISVDNDFSNANWVAIPGRDLFLHGLPSQTQSEFLGKPYSTPKVDSKAIQNVVREAQRLKIFEGIRYKSVDAKLNGKKTTSQVYEGLVTQGAIGTDIALTYGRKMSCVRIPVPSRTIQPVANYLNSINEPYVTGKKTYEWSMISDNCTHVSLNGFAVAGAREHLLTHSEWYQTLSNLAVPKNGLISMEVLANFNSLDLDKVFDDEIRKNSLQNSDWMISSHGALSHEYPIISQNDFYDTDAIAAQTLSRNYFDTYKDYRAHQDSQIFPAYHDLSSNLRMWQDYYQKLLDNSKEKSFIDRLWTDSEFEKFRTVYVSYLQRKIDEIVVLRYRLAH